MGHAMSTNTRVYADGYDISGDSSSAEVAATAVMADDSAFGVTGRTHQKGILDDTLTYEGFFDDAWNGSAEVGGVDYIFSQLRTATTQNADIISVYPNPKKLNVNQFFEEAAKHNQYICFDCIKNRMIITGISAIQVEQTAQSRIRKEDKSSYLNYLWRRQTCL